MNTDRNDDDEAASTLSPACDRHPCFKEMAGRATRYGLRFIGKVRIRQVWGGSIALLPWLYRGDAARCQYTWIWSIACVAGDFDGFGPGFTAL